MSLKQAAEAVRSAGRGKDTELVHLTKREVSGLHALAKAAGGSLTRNPETGMPEAGFLDSLLPTLLGVGANFIVPGYGMLVGGLTGALQNKDNPLLGAVTGAMGGYGGEQLAAGLQGAGAGAAQQVAMQGVEEAAKSAATGLPAFDPVAGGMVNEQMLGGVANAQSQAAIDATKGFLGHSADNIAGKPFYEQMGAGLSAAVNNPGQFVQGLGGAMPALKTAGMAAAPMLYESMMPGAEAGDMPEEGEASRYRYDAGYTGGESTGGGASSERRWFNPTYTRLAAGGGVQMASGGFVFPADVVSMLGNGSSAAGLEVLAKHLGATPIEGPGDGQSDSIPAEIDGLAPAAVARQEAYLSPEKVRAAGGEERLYALLDRVRQQAYGTKQQQRPVQPEQVLA